MSMNHRELSPIGSKDSENVAGSPQLVNCMKAVTMFQKYVGEPHVLTRA